MTNPLPGFTRLRDLRLPHADALERIGVELFDGGHFMHARDVFRVLLLDRPTSAAPWYWLARCHHELDESDTAERLCTLAVSVGHVSLKSLEWGNRPPQPKVCSSLTRTETADETPRRRHGSHR